MRGGSRIARRGEEAFWFQRFREQVTEKLHHIPLANPRINGTLRTAFPWCIINFNATRRHLESTPRGHFSSSDSPLSRANLAATFVILARARVHARLHLQAPLVLRARKVRIILAKLATDARPRVKKRGRAKQRKKRRAAASRRRR